ncbi:chorismate-binding protein [Paenibacillus sanguinis]|uniref:chorismate-binding protein n=1 Tax=Paenibacillus sanguinis TaxID=225906 RepID=UPI000371BC2B|nr:anthranilate synthase component I family protein [Paenibacillus sanguinis]
MEQITTWEQWEKWVEEGTWTLLPHAVSISLPSAKLPDAWSRAWQEASPYSFVLESGKGGRYTFLGLNPVSVLRGKGNTATVFELLSGKQEDVQGEPLKLLEEWMKPYQSPRLPGLPKFSGGAVGYLGYDVARSLERLPSRAQDDLGLDDYVWMRLDELWVIDQKLSILHCIVYAGCEEVSPSIGSWRQTFLQAEQRAIGMLDRWQRISRGCSGGEIESFQYLNEFSSPDSLMSDEALEQYRLGVSMSRQVFEDAVGRVQDYIRAGDVFQVNLSLRQAFPLQTAPERIYEQLRRMNPSPYMGLLRFPDFQLVSASPELLVKVEQGLISTRPIAGTRRRGHTPEEDQRMEEELRSNEKELAEHIMLVDLLRNDIGRVAAYGTVRASELYAIERYSHVMHLVSEVEGRLRGDQTIYNVIAAVFPGGTITGAPKVRTMEIIEELEPVTRGAYTGAMGWIDYSGNMELNIIIRTLVAKDGVGYVQAGAGIVIDSVPYREFRECHNKARAIALAVRHSEGVPDKAQDRR